MKISLSQLRKIIRETVEESMMGEAEKEDLNKDGDHDFEDVMIARMKASGMPHDKAVEKGEEAAQKAKSKKQSVREAKCKDAWHDGDIVKGDGSVVHNCPTCGEAVPDMYTK